MKKIALDKLFLYGCYLIFILFGLIFLIDKNVLLGLLLFSSVFFLVKKIKLKHFPIYLILLTILIRILGILFFNVAQVSDFHVLLEAARKFAINDYQFNLDPYFVMWPYQVGFVIYEGLILKIVNSQFILKLLNIFYEAGLTLLIYQFSKKLIGEKPAQLVSILYAIYPFSIYHATVLSNHHLSSLLGYLAIYLLLFNKKEKNYYYIIAGLLIALSNIIRPEGIIIIFSYIFYRILKIKKKTIFKEAKQLFILLLTYISINFLASFTIIQLGIHPDGLKNNNPLWKFVLGTNLDTCGRYATQDEIYLYDEQKEWEIIKERINHPSKIISLLSCKTTNFVLNGNLESSSGIYENKTFTILGISLSYPLIEKIISGINNTIYLIVFLFFIIGIIYSKNNILKNNIFYFLILFITNYFVYLLIEIQPRYTYFIQITLFILASNGIKHLFDYLDNKRKMKNT